MGALHAGHLSLIEKSIEQCNHTVVSIFVNKKQFAPDEDFEDYYNKNANIEFAKFACGHVLFATVA